jgi:hypothetical protein
VTLTPTPTPSGSPPPPPSPSPPNDGLSAGAAAGAPAGISNDLLVSGSAAGLVAAALALGAVILMSQRLRAGGATPSAHGAAPTRSVKNPLHRAPAFNAARADAPKLPRRRSRGELAA